MAVATNQKLPRRMGEKWFTKAEAAEELGMSISTIDRKVSAGHLKKSSYNGITIISRRSVADYLAKFGSRE